MEDERIIELNELKARCLKKDGTPRKDADTADLERLKLLAEEFEAEQEIEEQDAGLSEEEEAELADLEARASQGRHIAQPSPTEMVRLGELRKRAKATA